MGTDTTDFVASGTASKVAIDSRFDDIERYLNGGIVSADLQASAWAGARHLVKPRFFGAPAPRVTGTTFDVHWRGELSYNRDARSIHHGIYGLDDYVPVRNTGGTFKCRTTTTFQILTSAYAWTSGGDMRDNIYALATNDVEQRLAGTFAIFVNGSRRAGTRRRLWAAVCYSSAPYTPEWSAKKQITSITQVTLSAGVHDIEVRVKPVTPTLNNDAAPTTALDWKHIWVEGRTMVAWGHHG